MKQNKVKHFIGTGIKFVIGAVVLLFLGLKSLDFFYFTTPADQWYYAYLGFGLTGGGVIAYLLIFLWDADTPLKKTVAIVMLFVCVIGELATAGFGLQVNAWQKQGYSLTNSDFDSMVLVVQLLGFAHAIALIAYVAGDELIKAFADEDDDGIPNYRDPDYKRSKKQPQPQVVYQSVTLDDVTAKTGLTVGQMRSKFPKYQDFAAWLSQQMDISGKNMRKLYHGEVNPQRGGGKR